MALADVVDHKIVYKDQAARRERREGASGQNGHVLGSNRTPKVRHENYVAPGRPIGGNRISSEIVIRSARPASRAYRLAVSIVCGKSRIVAESCGLAAQKARL